MSGNTFFDFIDDIAHLALSSNAGNASIDTSVDVSSISDGEWSSRLVWQQLQDIGVPSLMSADVPELSAGTCFLSRFPSYRSREWWQLTWNLLSRMLTSPRVPCSNFPDDWQLICPVILADSSSLRF